MRLVLLGVRLGTGPGAEPRSVEADGERSLVDVLRKELGVKSVSRACDDGSCGACRVLMDGALSASCRVRWADVRDGATIESYETLASDPSAAKAVAAFESERPTRCRMCVGALGVTAVAIARSSEPRDLATESALRDATCMCTGRGSWRRALENGG